MVQELQYKGETEGKFCAICKLDYYDNQKILFCPNCESLFHEEHLISWLNLNSECPVCARDFTKEIEKYSLRDSNINNEEEISVDNLPFRELKFSNSKSDEEPESLSIFNRFIAIIIGLFF